MVTEPLQAFMVASTVVTVALTVAGIAISAVWFRSVLRRSGLRVRFAARCRGRRAATGPRGHPVSLH